MSIKVLLVDDETSFRQALARRLRKRDMDVREADDGKAALRELEASPVDVVILDLRMPGMNGLDTLEAIKERLPRTEVILLSGQVDLESSLRGLDLGALDYCIKPMDIDELHDKIIDAHKRATLRNAGDS